MNPQGITLIDGTGAPPRENMTIAVDADRTSSVVATTDLDDNQLGNPEIIDARRWHGLPDMIDSHVHPATLPDRERA